MNIDDLPDESDTSDEDYVPSEQQEDLPSEIDSDENLEEPLSDPENPDSKGKKRKKKISKAKKKLKDTAEEQGISKENGHKPEENKQSVDDIWADFMKDTGFKPRNSKQTPTNVNSLKTKENNTSNTTNNDTSKKQASHPPVEKVKITQIFEFAGEEVKVEKEVPVYSAEARLLNKSLDNDLPKTSKGKRSAGLSGISNVLSQLGKKPKISTLEKSKLDWDRYKKEENIEEELQTYNKGKEGYLDKQDFLQRADLRRFEIEKDIRAVERSKRFNSTL